MIIWLLVLALLGLVGCSSTNVSELMKALASDPNGNCVQVGTPYGTIVVARGTPQLAVEVSAGSCKITGNGVTSVTVPQSSVIVAPGRAQQP